MISSPGRRPFRALALLVAGVSALAVAGCGTTGPGNVTHKKSRSKEYFAESEYGVKASPRVTNERTRLKRGGGRDQVGRPYKVKGKWYYPKEDRGYRKTGAASWYGDAFHGRLTANGEIYDMTHLTAAHPTMPLPSYARVTNTANGSSVIVRVNDRGPYANGRIIDLSKRAAEMLDYTHAGVAKVKVEYMGRAPLHGQDDQYLMASYRPGKGQGRFDVPDPSSDGLPTGVMVAMNGPTPTGGGLALASMPQPVVAGDAVRFGETVVGIGDPMLPDFGPIAPERPMEGFGGQMVAMASLSYADERVKTASEAFSTFDRGAPTMNADALVEAWKAAHQAGAPDEYVAAGSFDDRRAAESLAARLSRFGRTSIDIASVDGRTWYSVEVRPTGTASVDAVLEAAWANGAPDALSVR